MLYLPDSESKTKRKKNDIENYESHWDRTEKTIVLETEGYKIWSKTIKDKQITVIYYWQKNPTNIPAFHWFHMFYTKVTVSFLRKMDTSQAHPKISTEGNAIVYKINVLPCIFNFNGVIFLFFLIYHILWFHDFLPFFVCLHADVLHLLGVLCLFAHFNDFFIARHHECIKHGCTNTNHTNTL